jgi:hypothetical protein
MKILPVGKIKSLNLNGTGWAIVGQWDECKEGAIWEEQRKTDGRSCGLTTWNVVRLVLGSQI